MKQIKNREEEKRMSKKTDTEIIIEALNNLSDELKKNGTIYNDLISTEAMNDMKKRRSAELETQQKKAEDKKMEEIKDEILKGMMVK